MLDQVVNEALPSRYGQAVTESDVRPLGQPEIEVTKKEYGEELVFTAEVDVRPDITLPDLSALKITVDPIEVSDEEVDAELQSLRARFGTLTGVERAAADGDFVSIDLSATVDGEDVPEAADEGLSHEVGSGQLIDGLDDAIIGLKAGESKVVHHQAGRRRARRPGGRGHRHRRARSRSASCPSPTTNSPNWQANSTRSTSCVPTSSDQVSRVKRVQQAEEIRDTPRWRPCSSRSTCRCPRRSCRPRWTSTVHNALHGLDHDEAKLAEALEKQGIVARGVRRRHPHATPRRPSRRSCCSTRWPTTSTSRSARTT